MLDWRSTAVRAFLTNLSDSSLEERLFANLESLNPEELLDGAEAALTDGTARQRLLSHVTDLCLDFLLDYLPSMPIPAITVPPRPAHTTTISWAVAGA